MPDAPSAQSKLLAVTIGFAADEHGRGVAYAAIPSAGDIAIARVPFALKLRPALQGRDVGYAAFNAVSEEVLQRGHKRVEFCIDDERLVTDLAERRTLPVPLTVPYVALRCRLNRYEQAELVARPSRMSRDLTNRARAEASLQIAA